jgi:hypothetical protein
MKTPAQQQGQSASDREAVSQKYNFKLTVDQASVLYNVACSNQELIELGRVYARHRAALCAGK